MAYETSPLSSTLAKITHLNITGRLSYDKNAHPFDGGAYGDIRLGTLDSESSRGRVKVAVKCLRVFQSQNPGFMKIIEKEIRVWSKLDHKNILPLLGYSLENNAFPTLISEFMENGTILKYCNAHPELDITNMILGIAEGIGYLHDKGVIHSDLKTDNVLVSATGEPLVCDFGISRIISNTLSGQSAFSRNSTSSTKGSARWMSPELLDPEGSEDALHTKESDIWAFGMTAYELLTKKLPYHNLRQDGQVIMAVVKGGLPSRPEDSSYWSPDYQYAWAICEECWFKDPKKRPSIDTIISKLRHYSMTTSTRRNPTNPNSVRAIAARNRNPLPCACCQNYRQGCRRGFPCEQCLRKLDECVPGRVNSRFQRSGSFEIATFNGPRQSIPPAETTMTQEEVQQLFEWLSEMTVHPVCFSA